jgi:hypothetical protein
MGRRAAEEFSGTPLGLVYIAGNTVDAERMERALTEGGIDYTLSLEPFMKSSALGTVFGGTYAGVFFFVPAAQHESCRGFLELKGFEDTIGPEVSLENSHGA